MELGSPGSLDFLPQAEKKGRKQDSCQVDEARRRRVQEAAAVLFAEYGPRGVSRRHAADAARMHRSWGERLYASDADLLGDVLADFVYGLAPQVHAAFDASKEYGPVARLEAVIRAWLDYVAEHAAANRAFLLGLPQTEAERREGLTLKYWSVVETVADALRGAVPGLETLSENLKESMRSSLSDAWSWPRGRGLEERGVTARRIAGMLMAAGRAEACADWTGLGPVGGIGPMGQRVVTCEEARARFSDLIDYAAAGGEMTVLRYGRAVAKVVGVNAEG